ncbi:septum site-determining protein Ssd [Streptomyces zingiberis]|uniref:Septum formation initiator n=1 Tax=Streptomyces zingiberis TaxID=2053010 RepID=A0ABX1BT66_9ACTN|nr:septum site-determining protein Ssd [Streptomyces zingiberis]NJP99064.1 septum formation initiator [Streptomyces zingiberis]
MNGPSTSGRWENALPEPGPPLVVTEDDQLLDDLLRLCAAAGTEPEVCHGPPEPSGWERPPLVLVGDDAVPRLRATVRRPGVLLVGRHPRGQDIWRRAVGIGADHVVPLPGCEAWLVDRIADAVEGTASPALSVGVIGGRGGAGASTLACALAVTAAREGRRTMLVDGDPLGGGLDVLLAGEGARGLRWPAFAHSRGRVAAAALEESLPSLRSLRLLSWDRGDAVTVDPQAMRAVLSAARRRGGAVVVDLPRRVDETVAEALSQLDLGLLVVSAGLRSVAAARRVVSAVRPVLPDLRVVVRGPCEAGLGDEEIAAVLGLPLAGEIPPEPGLPAEAPAEFVPGDDARGPLARFSSAFWAHASAVDGGVTP